MQVSNIERNYGIDYRPSSSDELITRVTLRVEPWPRSELRIPAPPAMRASISPPVPASRSWWWRLASPITTSVVSLGAKRRDNNASRSRRSTSRWYLHNSRRCKLCPIKRLTLITHGYNPFYRISLPKNAIEANICSINNFENNLSSNLLSAKYEICTFK